MPDTELRRDRDKASARLFARHAREKNNEYRSWTLEEVRGLFNQADIIGTMTNDAARMEQVALIKERLVEIRDNQMDNIYNVIDGKISEIYEYENFTDPIDARDFLEEGLCRFEALQRELLKYRDQLDEIWAPPG